MAFVEVADRIWVSRQEWFDLNVILVGGEAGLVVVDTHASSLAARGVIEEIRALGVGAVTAVVNTHEHFDHTFGNGAFLQEYADVPVHATEEAAARTTASGERIKELYLTEPEDPHGPEVRATTIVPATETFSSVRVLDLGDRQVELVHPGRGHTGGDLVARIPDADVLLAGDLVEESGPPNYGADSFPLEWPSSLDLVLGLLSSTTVVIPGHGSVTDRDFVVAQQADVGRVAETIRELASEGVLVEDALASAEWPFPAERLADAVRRGYAQLPRDARRLPLL